MSTEVIAEPSSMRSLALQAVMKTFRKVPDNPDLPAHELVLKDAVLEKERIEEFAKVCGFLPEQGVPLTWPHMLAFPVHLTLMLKPEFPFPLIGQVHLANSITQHEALTFGQALSFSVKLGQFIAHDKGQAYTFETKAMSGDRVVWESVSTYLRRGVKSPQGEPYSGLPTEPELDAIEERWKLSGDLGRRYAKVSGDSNPIHTSRIGAKILGFKQPIAHGMWSKARALAALLPKEPIANASVDVNFKTPAFLPGSACFLTLQHEGAAIFEVRDGANIKPHLRGKLSL